MAKASAHPSSEFVKVLYVGASGSGKTGSLVSLLKAGYKVYVLDLDNGLDALIQAVKETCPEKLDDLDFLTYRDKMKADPMKGARVSGPARAYTNAIKAMEKWDDGSDPAEWGPQCVFVLDSLTLFGRAAFNWAVGLNPECKDPRQWYATAQESLLKVLDLLTSAEFKTNVIVMTHIDVVEEKDGNIRAFASSIGKALGPKIPAVFNTMIMAESRGTGDNVRRTVTTAPTSLINLKNPKPNAISKSMPFDTALATIFKELTSK